MDQLQTAQLKSKVNAPGLDDAKRRMERAIVEAEKFRAAVEKPPGRSSSPMYNTDMGKTQLGGLGMQLYGKGGHLLQTDSDKGSGSADFKSSEVSEVSRQEIGAGTSDDDFFHLTCHIDPTLRKKIENGEFVDLDKLLHKDNTFQGRVVNTNETKLEWVQSEGSTYLVPAKSSSRINCFRRWEQAFRMYATVYCTKHPNHAREIWQYVSIINTASMSYNWDNVYNYDVVFRQLMEFNPSRSWAVTYNQMWNLSMTTPLIQNQTQRRNSNNNFVNVGTNSVVSKKKLDYCWSFNKGVKCKFGKKCKFIERCSYCDDSSHGVINCSKLEKRDRENKGKERGRPSK